MDKRKLYSTVLCKYLVEQQIHKSDAIVHPF